MLVALDDRFVSRSRSARFESGLPKSSALSQEVPAGVQGCCQLRIAAPVGFRVLAARLLLPESVLFGHQLFDRLMDLAVVDVTSFGPKMSSAYERQRRAATVV